MSSNYIVVMLLTLQISAPIAAEDNYPWSRDSVQCDFPEYSPTGVFPTLTQTLRKLELGHRITRGLDLRKVRWNYHGPDFENQGHQFTAAVDISIRCLSDNQIKELLGVLASNGIAAWLRKKDHDGWDGPDHIHAIWTYAKLKRVLKIQVENWMIGLNGLASNKAYKYWKPTKEQIEVVQTAFSTLNSK